MKSIPLNQETGRACFAVAVACIAGCAWWVLHRKYFVEVYWNLVPFARAKGFVPQGFDGLFAALNLATAIGQSFSVGFLAGAFAPRRPYRLAFAAMILTFWGKFPVNLAFYDFAESGGRRPDETWWITGLFLLIYGSGPLCGAFLAQAFKPRTVYGKPRDEGAPLPANPSAAYMLVGALGFCLILSLFWKTVLAFALLSLGLFYFVIPLLQSATIGFCVARCVPFRKEEYAIGVALLMFVFDVILWLAGTRFTGALFLDLGFWTLAAFCAGAALCGSNLAGRNRNS